jgi:hypothetical protein
VLPVNLGGYAPELEGRCLFVWVNPPRKKLTEYDELVTALQERELVQAKRTLVEEDAESGGEKAEKTVLARAFDQVGRMLRRRKEQPAEGIDEQLLRWYAEIWSCGPDDTGWTVAELREMEAEDPSVLSWMIAQTWAVRKAHIERKKKS